MMLRNYSLTCRGLLAALFMLPLGIGCGSPPEEPKSQVDIEKSRQEHIDVSRREQAEG